MRAVVQRVTRAEVRVNGRAVGRIGRGLLVLLGVANGDTLETGRALADKIVNLRVFPDGPDGPNGPPANSPEIASREKRDMNRSLLEVGGSVLCVSQFTLYGDCRKGRRPSYDRAAPPETARSLYEGFLQSLRDLLPGKVEAGQFQAMMDVELVNEGPATLILDSDRLL